MYNYFKPFTILKSNALHSISLVLLSWFLWHISALTSHLSPRFCSKLVACTQIRLEMHDCIGISQYSRNITASILQKSLVLMSVVHKLFCCTEKHNDSWPTIKRGSRSYSLNLTLLNYGTTLFKNRSASKNYYKLWYGLKALHCFSETELLLQYI